MPGNNKNNYNNKKLGFSKKEPHNGKILFDFKRYSQLQNTNIKTYILIDVENVGYPAYNILSKQTINSKIVIKGFLARWDTKNAYIGECDIMDENGMKTSSSTAKDAADTLMIYYVATIIASHPNNALDNIHILVFTQDHFGSNCVTSAKDIHNFNNIYHCPNLASCDYYLRMIYAGSFEKLKSK